MRAFAGWIVRHQDPLLAGAVVIALVAELAAVGIPPPDDGALDPGGMRWVATFLAGVLAASGLLVRRTQPLATIALAVIAGFVSPAGPFEGPVALTFASMAAAYAAGAHLEGRGQLAGVLGVAALVIAGAVPAGEPIEEPGDVLALLALAGGPWLAGVAMRERRGREAALLERAVAAEQDRERKAAAAVDAERARIARELHDVVAHAIAVIVLQARGARRALATAPGAAAEALDEIDATASGALVEMRRMVGVLRADAAPVPLEPAPGLEAVGALVARVREAGLPVELDVEGDVRSLTPGLELAAYRIVQEALTNALRHAGSARARVTIRYLPTALELDVVDSGGPSVGGGGGNGVIGMRERAALYGGQLAAGPRPEGGFGVRVTLPTAATT